METEHQSTILAIDNEPLILESIVSYFKDRAFDVIVAENGRIGLEMFRRERSNIILVDLRMPEVDGFEVLTTVTKESPNTPVILVSGTDVITDVVEALRMGAWIFSSPYMTWPFRSMR